MERLNKDKLPRHIAIIMDGNGRWAKKRILNRVSGHQKGAEAVREAVKTCRELGIEVLTLYAFSMENWNRPKGEVSALMSLLRRYLFEELDEMLENNIRLNAIGDLENLPDKVYKVLTDTIEKTKACKGMILNLALSYGGRDDIIHAVRKIISDCEAKKIKPENITEELFSNYLFTAGIPDPDLLIRTSGEHRISNFLLWQMAYTEIYITDTLWPDFKKEDLIEAILDFQSRERRFGLTSSQIRDRKKKGV
ncbi:MAG: isoprenyl transferase [Deltaproteobacteria bacterium CG_4_9_14_3_um_filter_44_9]|nr:MAG: isoprenyl transferase [Deltaproteobacteria bacterium CG06_land_8_20_14_3_00_44_19]PIZ20309.1 MAG: isoprenyl transferase [Deltaproteobacteria bacterium CG_4_10_14_0_8_um_filter_43_12]PJB43755.1 MAG: isoprenyl transferase [Deltaproteobacteria bacterium CG_4_9_14_3_um_filter_44_9]